MLRENKYTLNIDGGTTTDVIEIGYGFVPTKLYIPASFSGTAITFTMSDTKGGTYSPLKDSADAAISLTVSANNWYKLDPTTFAGIEFMRIVSGATETDKDVKLITSPLVARG